MVVIVVFWEVVDPEAVSLIDAWKKQGQTQAVSVLWVHTLFIPDMEALGGSQGPREEKLDLESPLLGALWGRRYTPR